MLREPAVVRSLLGRQRRLAVPGLAQRAEVAERVELRALLAGVGALVDLVHVEHLRGHRNAGGRLRFHRVRSGEGRERHGVRADLRELVGLRAGQRQVPGAAVPGGGAHLVRHAALVARRPRRIRQRRALQLERLGGVNQQWGGEKNPTKIGAHKEEEVTRGASSLPGRISACTDQRACDFVSLRFERPI